MSYNSEAVGRSKKKRKLHFVEMFGGKCQSCGYDRCVNALEFHHLNQAEKKANPSTAIYRWNYAAALVEIRKCILICANCHREHHWKELKEFQSEFQSKLTPVTWSVVVCAECNDSFETPRAEQRFCGIPCSAKSQRKVVRPDAAQLKKLIDDGEPWVTISKRYGVSDNTIRKWARGYGLMRQ